MKYEHFFPTPDTENWNITVVSRATNNTMCFTILSYRIVYV